MSFPYRSNFIDITNVDVSWIVQGFLWIFIGKVLDFVWKRLNITLKSKQFYFGLRGLKYQFLYNYEGWRISRKRKGSKYINYTMSKKERQYFCQMLISDLMINPKMDDEGQRILQLFVKSAYPEGFRRIFGETKYEVRARINIEKFFQINFA